MGRYTDAKCRLCRREGIKLFLKGTRCETPKCPITKRNSPPGQQRSFRRRMSEYGTRLREKQRFKRMYGLYETQFRRFYHQAERMPGNTGNNLMTIVESRLDNVLYRAGFAASHAQARQLVRHGHIEVNGRRVNIPSFLVEAGQSVRPRKGRGREDRIRATIEEMKGREIPSWLSVSEADLEIRIVAAPIPGEMMVPVESQLIVELASR